MSKSLNDVSNLSTPIQTTSADVIISGHGAYTHSGETTVPDGFELWVLGPPGASISDPLGGALESGTRITKLGIQSPTTHEWSPVVPTVYAAGTKAPDYSLYAPRGLQLKPGGPHLIGVEGSSGQKLSTLWARVQPFAKPGKKVRVFWAACSAIAGAKNQVVCHQ